MNLPKNAIKDHDFQFCEVRTLWPTYEQKKAYIYKCSKCNVCIFYTESKGHLIFTQPEYQIIEKQSYYYFYKNNNSSWDWEERLKINSLSCAELMIRDILL